MPGWGGVGWVGLGWGGDAYCILPTTSAGAGTCLMLFCLQAVRRCGYEGRLLFGGRLRGRNSQLAAMLPVPHAAVSAGGAGEIRSDQIPLEDGHCLHDMPNGQGGHHIPANNAWWPTFMVIRGVHTNTYPPQGPR